MTRPFLLVLALLTLAGCAPPPKHYDVLVDPSMPAEWVETAAAQWRDKTGEGGAELDVRYDLDSCEGRGGCLRIIGVSHDVIADLTGRPDGTGWTHCEEWPVAADHCTIYIALESVHEPRANVEHEMGHAMGLEHERSTACVMYPDLRAGPHHVTCCDGAQWRSVRGLMRLECVD